MLIIQDNAKQLAEIQQLIVELDKPEPQVEIEAKIMQTNREAAKALGVQWGINGRVAPELGNTTGLGFPNRGTVGGRVQQQGPVTQGPTIRARPPWSAPAPPSTCRCRRVVGARPVARRHQRRVRHRHGDYRARAPGQGQDSVDAARDDAEQQAGGSHAGLPDSDSDAAEQHRLRDRSRTRRSSCW